MSLCKVRFKLVRVPESAQMPPLEFSNLVVQCIVFIPQISVEGKIEKDSYLTEATFFIYVVLSPSILSIYLSLQLCILDDLNRPWKLLLR